MNKNKNKFIITKTLKKALEMNTQKLLCLIKFICLCGFNASYMLINTIFSNRKNISIRNLGNVHAANSIHKDIFLKFFVSYIASISVSG